MVRRLRAICAHKHLDLDELAARRRLRLCFRVPKRTSGQELQAVAGELHAHPAALVILDPLYLAVAGGATGADLYGMGAVLSGIQAVCQQAGAALVVVTHWNKTGEGRGATLSAENAPSRSPVPRETRARPPAPPYGPPTADRRPVRTGPSPAP
jgi:hypothetical protein